MHAVVSDLDGTIACDDGTISMITMAALQSLRSLGIPLFLATGRDPHWIERNAALAAVTTAAVCLGGAVVWDPASSTCPWFRCFSADACDALGHHLQSLASCGIAAFSPELGWIATAEYRNDVKSRTVNNQRYSLAQMLKLELCALSIQHHQNAREEDVLMCLEGCGPRMSYRLSKSGSVEVSLPNLTKLDGVKWLLERHGISLSSTIAFGNDPPDLPLLEFCGVGVAMADGCTDLFPIATHIAPPASEGGVGHMLEQLIFLAPQKAIVASLAGTSLN